MNEPANPAPVEIGDVLAGKYRVERVLGIGGMGVVVAAMHIDLNEQVALKFLLPQVTQDPEAVARFLREAQAAVRIKSEHVARVTDVGRLEGGVPYMVMEYLTGRDLGDLVETEGRLAPDEAVDYVLQACEALSEAHGLGIVHRDLKPSNLFLSRRADGSPLIKVLDFGISKSTPSAGQSSHALTSTQAVMGSPIYMSPEHVRSARDVDRRTDIWSLGVVLHELIAGRPPFEGESVSGLLAAIVADEPLSLDGARPGLPPGLGAVVRRCLEKSRERRFGSVAELADALAPYAPDRARVSLERITGLSSAARASRPFLLPPPGGVSPPLDLRVPLLPSSADSRPQGANTAAAWGKAPGGEKRAPFRLAYAAAALLAIGLAALGGMRLFGGARSAAQGDPPETLHPDSSVAPETPPPAPAASTSPRAEPAASAPPPPGSGRAPASPSPRDRSRPGPGKTPPPGPGSTPVSAPPATPPPGKKPSDVPDSRD